MNLTPALDEQASYQLERDANTRVIRADYALFSLFPGIAPNRRVMILAGLTTSGTQGAAEFATSDAAMSDLLKTLAIKLGSRGAFPRYFQCLLRVEAAKGLDAMKVKYVTSKIIQSEP